MNRTPWIEMDGHPKKLRIYLCFLVRVMGPGLLLKL